MRSMNLSKCSPQPLSSQNVVSRFTSRFISRPCVSEKPTLIDRQLTSIAFVAIMTSPSCITQPRERSIATGGGGVSLKVILPHSAGSTGYPQVAARAAHFPRRSSMVHYRPGVETVQSVDTVKMLARSQMWDINARPIFEK